MFLEVRCANTIFHVDSVLEKKVVGITSRSKEFGLN